jgi:hypothetical protein
MKQTAVEWLFLQMENLITKAKVTDMDNNDFVIEKVKLLQQAKEMEKEQRGYSEEDVIKIVEKSRETGLTAEFLLLTFKSE